MKVNATEFNVGRDLDWNSVIDWAAKNIGKIKFTDRHSCQGEGWRLYTEIETHDWMNESTYWLEFDNDLDHTSFLLRWA